MRTIGSGGPFPLLSVRASRGLVVLLAVLMGLLLALPARAQSTRPDTRKQIKINLAWQIALDEAGFSPGIIDGSFGRKGNFALAEYADRYFPGLRATDIKVFRALNVNVEHALAKYTITDEAAALVGPLPDDWNEKSKLDHLLYESLIDCLSEKFHSTKGLIGRLNPGVNLAQLTVGQTIIVPNLRPFPDSGAMGLPTSRPTNHPGAATEPTTTSAPAAHRSRWAAENAAAYLRIDLAQKCIRVYDTQDRQMGLFHCSVAKDKAKLPARDTVIKVMADNPEYTFDPKHWPEVTNVDRIMQIPAGPRNPVGLAWIGLDLPGYGIHGNPKPELIGKTGSHGCFRLTNWDALRLYSMVHVGMAVKIVNPEKPGTLESD